MGQCVSRKGGAVIASGVDLIMEKPAKNGHKSGSKRGTSCTRGTAMSFGFRRRPTSGIPMPVSNYSTETSLHPRSKSAGPEQNRKHDDDSSNAMFHNSSSGRSTPRLAPPKKESSGIAVRTNRFGYRQPQMKFTNKVGDICSSNTVSHYDKKFQQPQQQQQCVTNNVTATKIKSSTAQNSSYNNNSFTHTDGNRRTSGIPEPVGRYTLHTSHLPLPQYAIRMADANSKIAKTAANQSKKVSAASKSSASSKEGSGTEDSGIGSQQSCSGENDARHVDYTDSGSMRRRNIGRSRNLRMVVNGKSFDVRDVRDDDNTVTEISVIPLTKSFATVNTGLVQERTSHYQRILNKDNRYTESTTSMSTTSSEGYDEGLSEEKVYKDKSHSEKIPSIKSDFSPPSSDDPEYGHGEAMADEYSLSSSDDCQRSKPTQYSQPISNATKTGTLQKNVLHSVLLTIEDPAFAAAAATSTTLIDDETSPVDSLFDSLTASITQSDAKASKKEHPMERSGNSINDDSPGTPTNASNSLSLSESREYFDDEIIDQPDLIFGENLRTCAEAQSGVTSQAVTDNSHTLVEPNSKIGGSHGKNTEKSPHHGRRISRAGSVDTLSPCESIASDDLILDYVDSDTSSYQERSRVEPNMSLQDMNEATIISELETQGEEVMRQWTSLLGTCQAQEQANDFNTFNNNVNGGTSNNNNQSANETGNVCDKNQWKNKCVPTPRSLDALIRNRQYSNTRSPRSNQSPCPDSGDEASLRADRVTYHAMFQDIDSIKTILLTLQRVIQEAETLNPFSNSMKNGIFYNLNEGGTADVSTSPDTEHIVADELADLRRQVVFLQGQLEDKDRVIQILQLQMKKIHGSKGTDGQSCSLANNRNNVSSSNMCNAATQTEKTRPVSAGPSLLQTLPQDGIMGPLVSWSDSWNRHPSLVAEMNCNRSRRKSIDRSPRAIKSCREEASHRLNRQVNKSLADSPPNRRSIKTEDAKSRKAKGFIESNDLRNI